MKMNLNKKSNFKPLPEPVVITEQVWPAGVLPLVHTRSMTFNHENYIRDCIEGILMQKTTFPVEVLIHDDASTDKTAKIVREYELKYPKIIKAYYQKENSYSQSDKSEKKRMRLEFDSMRIRKYEAICEGDDYWTDPLKLQKQVDFLERNDDFGMVYTKVRYFLQLKNKFVKTSWGGKATIFDQLIINNQIPTLTTVFRTDLLRGYIENIRPELHGWQMGDYPMWLYFALKSKIHFMDEETGVYRVLNESASHSIDLNKREDFVKSYYAIKQFFLEYANINYDKTQFEDTLLSSLGTNALMMKNRNIAKGYFGQMTQLTPKTKVKRIISSSRILSYFYRLKNEYQ